MANLGDSPGPLSACHPPSPEKEFLIDNLLVRLHFIIEIFQWTGLAPWESESLIPGRLISTCRVCGGIPDANSSRLLGAYEANGV